MELKFVVIFLSLLCFQDMFVESFKSLHLHHKSWQNSRRTNMNQLSAKKKHKVTVQHNGKDYILDVAENYSILDAALDAEIDLPHDCKLGVCLTCPARIVSGQVDSTGSTLDDSVTEQGFALTCCSYPRSDVVIRSIDEDELVNAQFVRPS
jgi:ferredoxin